jgi:hypothetical protein
MFVVLYFLHGDNVHVWYTHRWHMLDDVHHWYYLISTTIGICLRYMVMTLGS